MNVYYKFIINMISDNEYYIFNDNNLETLITDGYKKIKITDILIWENIMDYQLELFKVEGLFKYFFPTSKYLWKVETKKSPNLLIKKTNKYAYFSNKIIVR